MHAGYLCKASSAPESRFDWSQCTYAFEYKSPQNPRATTLFCKIDPFQNLVLLPRRILSPWCQCGNVPAASSGQKWNLNVVRISNGQQQLDHITSLCCEGIVSTVRCVYNTVNYFQSIHNRNAIAKGEVWGVYCEFQFWFSATFCDLKFVFKFWFVIIMWYGVLCYIDSCYKVIMRPIL